jgi:hypothetical protein
MKPKECKHATNMRIITWRDCKYYDGGMCILHEHPDCKGESGVPGIDCVHTCEMEYPCFDDAIIKDKGRET